jgi:hypothetical protein
MINSIDDIKTLWNPEDLGLSDEAGDSGVSPYEAFLTKTCARADRRIAKIVSAEVMSSGCDEVKQAEIEFVNVFVLEHLWHMKASGSEKTIKMPGGFEVQLQEFKSDEYERLVSAHIYNAERELGYISE